jgi:hypothetical protein
MSGGWKYHSIYVHVILLIAVGNPGIAPDPPDLASLKGFYLVFESAFPGRSTAWVPVGLNSALSRRADAGRSAVAEGAGVLCPSVYVGAVG